MKVRRVVLWVLTGVLLGYGLFARWRTQGLRIYSLNTTYGYILIRSWLPALLLGVLLLAAGVLLLWKQLKARLLERKEKKAQKKIAREQKKQEKRKPVERPLPPAEKEPRRPAAPSLPPEIYSGETVLLGASPPYSDNPVSDTEARTPLPVAGPQQKYIQAAPEAPAVQQAALCPICGKPIGSKKRFCTSCGASVPGEGGDQTC